MSNFIEEVAERNFSRAVLESEEPVLVDFWAQWCGPCRTLIPVVEALAEHYAGTARIMKLNVDKNPAFVERYRIQAIPTLILFRHGQEKERMIGAANREAIARTIDSYIGAESATREQR